jgi:hypothetical protein
MRPSSVESQAALSSYARATSEDEFGQFIPLTGVNVKQLPVFARIQRAGCAKKQKALDNSPELLAQLRFV